MAAHTPGPWIAELNRSSFGPNGRFTVCKDVTSGERTLICEMPHAFARRSQAAESEANARLIAAAPNLRDVAEALILFHSGDPWDETKRLRWLQLTGADEATTKTLCDLARAAIAKTEDAA